jgi:hypothetical protein
MIRRACIACILPLALASCGGNLAPVAATLAPAFLSPETVATMRTWCNRGAPLFAIAQAQTISPQAKEIAATVEPYCRAIVAGQVPPTTDANTPTWLPQNLAGLAAALGVKP